MPYALDEVDWWIIARLQQDGRTSNVEMARALGLAEATVRKRLEKLFDSGIIQVKAVVRPANLGFTTPIFIGIQVGLAQLEEAARQLAALPEIFSVKIVTGSYDVIAEAVLPSGEQLLPFLTAKIAAIPGVKQTDVCHVLDTVKWSCDYSLLNEPAAEPVDEAQEAAFGREVSAKR